ncbi:MAG: glycosyltransferase family 25 protein [Methylobacter sp.]|nr:glycosyltransferase family 25 protein [Methylobacter sp.]
MHSATKQLDGVYVINVKAFHERRASMEAQLLSQDMTAEFILDGDADELTAEVVSKYFMGDNLSANQMSCALKHIMALESIIENKQQQALVLEDDAIFSPRFNEGLRYAMEESPRFDGPKVIFIGCGGNFYTPKSLRKFGQHLYVGARGRFADSYIIDFNTAQKRLDWIIGNKISLPIDNQFEKIDLELGITMLWLEEPVVEQGSKAGLYMSALEKAPPAWLQKLLFSFEKLKRKYIYQLWR